VWTSHRAALTSKSSGSNRGTAEIVRAAAPPRISPHQPAARCLHSFCLLLQGIDIFLGADLFQDVGPNTDRDFTTMRFPEHEHHCAGLADASANAQRNFVLGDGMVIRELQEIELPRYFELAPESLSVDTNAHGTEFVAPPRGVIPDQNVAIQAVVSLVIDMLGFRNPIVVIGGARFVTIAVVEISGTVTIIRLRCFERLSSMKRLRVKMAFWVSLRVRRLLYSSGRISSSSS
jgi:hypothetical protein